MKRLPLSMAVLGTLLTLSDALSAQCPSVVFTVQQTRTDATSQIHEVEAIDVDGDGKLDLVGLSDAMDVGTSGVLTMWMGNGDGTFQTPVNLGTANLEALAVTDLNHDGHKDLILASGLAAGNQILVRMGNGKGFDLSITTFVDYRPSRLAAGLFDGDAFGDLIVTSADSNLVVFYHGLGNGTFTETRRFSPPQKGPFALAAGDFDGDGLTDFAVSYFNSYNVSVFFQNIDGSYDSPVQLRSASRPDIQGASPWRIAAGDLDEDGRNDLVVSNWESFPLTPSIAVFKHTGARTFSSTYLSPRPFHASGDFTGLGIRDLNHDGHLDIVVSGVNGSLVTAWVNNGNGTFRSPSYLASGNIHNYSLALGDLDGDTDLDLVLGGYKQLITAKSSCATQVYLYTPSPAITQAQTARLRVLVSGIAATTPLPRGTVTFREGATVYGTADIDDTGYAALDLPAISLRPYTLTHTLVADFSGNSEEGPATSQNLTFTMKTVGTTTTLDLPASSVYGTPYTFSVSVNLSLGSDIAHLSRFYILDVDGVLSERDDDHPVTLDLAPGPHTITASFEGDAFNTPSTSGPQPVTTLKATPGIANTTGAPTVCLGTPHSLQFALTGPNGVLAPTGTVQLKQGSTVLGSGTLVSSIATISATLERGVHNVTALYLGDGNFNGASMNLTLNVLPNNALAIDTPGLTNAGSVRCVLPANTPATALYGSNQWHMDDKNEQVPALHTQLWSAPE